MSKNIGKICFVVPSLSSGGAERVVSGLASQLVDDGYEAFVIKYFSCEHEYPISPALKVVCLSNGNEEQYNKISMQHKIMELRRVIKAEKPDYIIPFLPHVAFHVHLACLGLGIKEIQTIRVAPNVAPSSKVLRRIRDYLVDSTYATFVQTESQKRYFKKKTQNKIFVLPNPIANEMFDADVQYPDRLSKIVSVGRLSKQKNFPLIIDTVKRIRDKGRDVELAIYGDGELREALQEYIDNIGAAEYCKLCGRSNHVVDVYANNHVFVLSSDFEGMPNALMEAMAAGLPCISTDCETGPSDLIDENNGILVPVGNIEKMEEALLYLLDNPQAAADMGKNAHSFMQSEYSAKRILERLINEVILWRK